MFQDWSWHAIREVQVQSVPGVSAQCITAALFKNQKT